jgi:uracil-DNA glycosylase
MTAATFCPGYPAPYEQLVADCPDQSAYPPDAFRVEWGPIFHRGRLDGTARLLVLGQDPAVQETITRRILVGVAGQRTQGLLARLGLTESYVLINTFVYSVYGQSGGTAHLHDEPITDYRNRWLTTLIATNPITAIITLGSLAADAYTAWTHTPDGAAYSGHHAPLLHPTYPDSASAHGQISKAEATIRLLNNWNGALPGLVAALPHPDQPPTGTPYGAAFTAGDLPPIPGRDLPAGLPAWMRSGTWGRRAGTTAALKRATIELTIPAAARATDPDPAA